jgi:hypothetical protein
MVSSIECVDLADHLWRRLIRVQKILPPPFAVLADNAHGNSLLRTPLLDDPPAAGESSEVRYPVAFPPLYWILREKLKVHVWVLEMLCERVAEAITESQEPPSCASAPVFWFGVVEFGIVEVLK